MCFYPRWCQGLKKRSWKIRVNALMFQCLRKERRSNVGFPVSNKSWLCLPTDYICIFSPLGSFDGQMHVMQYLMRNQWFCFGPALLRTVRRIISLGPLSSCCASEQNNILLFKVINNSSKDTHKKDGTYTNRDINLIKVSWIKFPGSFFAFKNFPSCIISSNIGMSWGGPVVVECNIKIW